MHGFLEHLEEHYTKDGGPLAGYKLAYSPADSEGRRVIAVLPDRQMVLTAKPVGGRNSGAFLGWVTISKGDWRRIKAEMPAGWQSRTVTIGYAPDDETIWWSAIYDDAVLALLQPESMDDDRWFRFSPENAQSALLSSVNLLPQQTLDLVEGAVVTFSGPGVREVVSDVIHSGLSWLLDDEEIKHLDTKELVAINKQLIRAFDNVAKWREVRAAQSYSRQKAGKG